MSIGSDKWALMSTDEQAAFKTSLIKKGIQQTSLDFKMAYSLAFSIKKMLNIKIDRRATNIRATRSLVEHFDKERKMYKESWKLS